MALRESIVDTYIPGPGIRTDTDVDRILFPEGMMVVADFIGSSKLQPHS